MTVRAFQWDLARQVERLDFLQSLLPRYAAWGYQELYLHLEDAVHYPSLPGIGREDAYRHEQIGELVATAKECGIGVVPIVNLLGHTQYLIKHPDWRELNELRDDDGGPLPSGQICPLHPRTPEVAALLLRDTAPFCTAGKVHVGLDESFHLGRCPRCREEVSRLGLASHFAGHVRRLHALAEPYGLRLGLWADMLYFVPEAIPQLPRGIVAYDWYYYPFAGKPRVELFNFAERDLFPALKKQGIAYYGCPMNGAFRHEPLPVFGDRLANIRSWWDRCARVGAEGLLVTSWEAYRLALETTTVVDAAAANLWLDSAHDDATSLLASGLQRVFRPPHARALARTLLAADVHAFAGYARWQINDRWDVFAGTESLKPYENEERVFRRMLEAGPAWPRALAASLSFRHYLARRDVFVRRAAREIFRLRRVLARDEAGAAEMLRALLRDAGEFRRALRVARRDVRVMWKRTREASRPGQNDAMLDRDAGRMEEWMAWLRSAIRQPSLARGRTPVCGAWQLQFVVHNVRPALQKVVVEEQQPDGGWRELGGRFTIEFRAQAARPRSKIRREFTVPVEAPASRLRIAVRGVGRVEISHVALTDGVETRRAQAWSRRVALGRPAPTRGLPELDWARNTGEWAVRF